MKQRDERTTEERAFERSLQDRRPIWAFAEAAAGAIGLVTLAFSFVYGIALGIALGGVLLSLSGFAGLAYGDVPLLQIRVLISRAWARRFATLSRVVLVPIGIGLAILGISDLLR